MGGDLTDLEARATKASKELVKSTTAWELKKEARETEYKARDACKQSIKEVGFRTSWVVDSSHV